MIERLARAARGCRAFAERLLRGSGLGRSEDDHDPELEVRGEGMDRAQFWAEFRAGQREATEVCRQDASRRAERLPPS